MVDLPARATERLEAIENLVRMESL